MNEKELLQAIRSLGIFSDRSGRSPHKPILILYALGKLQAGVEQLGYNEVKKPLKEMLEQLLPHRKRHRPDYPFWYLKNDGGIWVIPNQELVEFRKSKKEPKPSSLAKLNIEAGFSPSLLKLLKRRPELIAVVAHELLEAHFPSSMHDDVIALTGIDVEPKASTSTKRRRDPRFRGEVLRAYRRECAVCGFSIRLDDLTIGLDAAHIKWHQAMGPDTASNGLSLCSLHHKLLDRGAFTLNNTMQVVVSSYVNGPSVSSYLDAFHGKAISLPKDAEHHPNLKFLDWHREQVFLG